MTAASNLFWRLRAQVMAIGVPPESISMRRSGQSWSTLTLTTLIGEGKVEPATPTPPTHHLHHEHSSDYPHHFINHVTVLIVHCL